MSIIKSKTFKSSPSRIYAREIQTDFRGIIYKPLRLASEYSLISIGEYQDQRPPENPFRLDFSNENNSFYIGLL